MAAIDAAPTADMVKAFGVCEAKGLGPNKQVRARLHGVCVCVCLLVCVCARWKAIRVAVRPSKLTMRSLR